MLIYEVNLVLQDSIRKDFMKWLFVHIDDMLKIKGFNKAEVFEDQSGSSLNITCNNDLSNYLVSVQYQVNSLEDLKKYFDLDAVRMRGDAINLFGEKFSATRRVLKGLSL